MRSKHLTVEITDRQTTDRREICCLSVTMLHPTQRLERFGNTLHILTAYGLGQFVLKF